MSDINFYISCTFSSAYYLKYFIFLNLVKYVIFTYVHDPSSMYFAWTTERV